MLFSFSVNKYANFFTFALKNNYKLSSITKWSNRVSSVMEKKISIFFTVQVPDTYIKDNCRSVIMMRRNMSFVLLYIKV